MSQLNRYQAMLFMLFCLMIAATLRFPDLPKFPPGVHYDEAANGVLAREIGFEGERPLFITSYTGKEVLFFYMAGGVMRLVGDSVFALRATAAFLGILTVAATYWLGMELFSDRRIALLGAALLAVSFWHLLFSRLGFRAVSQPLLQALALAALWRGYRREQWRWLVVGGLFLGLTAYTYLAARVFPLLLLLSLLPLLVSRKRWAERWRQTAVAALAALLVAAPLLNYFRLNPDAFWVRISQVGPGDKAVELGDSLLSALGMFFLQGDPYWRFNLPGRPLFDWFWGGLLVVGWIMLIVRWRRPASDWERAGNLLVILAPLLMLLPTALAVNEIFPSNLRAIGLIPFIFYLPSVGLMILLDDLYNRFQRPQPTLTIYVIAILVLIVGGIYVESLYFGQWAQREDVFFETDADLTAVAAWLDGIETDEQHVYVGALHYQHPTLAFLSDKYEQLKWLPRSQAVVFPAEGTALYIYPFNSPYPKWADTYFAGARLVDNLTSPAGSPSFIVLEITSPPPLTPTHTVNANFDNIITLLGYDAGSGGPEETLPLTLYWQVQQPPAGDYTPFVHLEDQWGHRWGQVETFAYPSSQWEPGEVIVQRVEVPVPAGIPPGDYQLNVGLFAEASGDQLPRFDAAGRYAGQMVQIPAVPVLSAGMPESPSQPRHIIDREIRPYLRLLGFERSGPEVVTGEPYGLGLWWLATRPISPTITQFALTQPTGHSFVLTETQPVHGTYPFTAWEPPQFIIDRQSFVVSEDVPAGNYQLVVRFLDAEGEIMRRANLGPLQVMATQRQFVPPSFETAVNATFGDEIELLGYSLNPTEADNQYTLNLIWQARQVPQTDYTVFVHLLQPDGTCAPCPWQADRMPQQEAYPTSRWLADEVVIDTYTVVLPEAPPASYPLEVGLYIAETGQRLQAVTAVGGSGDAVSLDPITP